MASICGWLSSRALALNEEYRFLFPAPFLRCNVLSQADVLTMKELPVNEEWTEY